MRVRHTHTFMLHGVKQSNTLTVISVCDVQRPRGETAEKKEMMMNKCVNYREEDVKLHTHTQRECVYDDAACGATFTLFA